MQNAANLNLKLLIEHIKTVLDKESEDFAAVLKILDSYEDIKLNNSILDTAAQIEYWQLEEIKMKIVALLSLVNILEENPKIKRIVEESQSQNKQDVVKLLYDNIFEMSNIYFDNIGDSWEKIYTLTILSLVSLISDNQPIADVLIEQHIKKLHKSINLRKPDMAEVEYLVYLLILKLTCRISSADDIYNLEDLLREVEKSFDNVQKNKAEAEELEIRTVMEIGALGNIIYVLKGVISYILNGKITWEIEVDIFTFIDTYSYNAVKLSKSTSNMELITVSSLLPRSMKQLCRNSIWGIADKSPALKEFFKKCLESDENLIYTLLPSQRDSILKILSNKKSIVLNMPTSSGKTLLAELYIVYILYIFREKDEDRKPTVAYIVPTNALVNQMRRDLTQKFVGFEYRIETALPFYKTDKIEDEVLESHHIDILITTPEKLDFLVRRNHSSIKNLKLVVLDEAHNIKDDYRGSKFELLLATIKQRKKGVNFLLLSPFIENAKEIAEWLGDSELDSIPITMNWSPTKQYVGCNLLEEKRTKSIVRYFPTPRNNIIKDAIDIDLRVNPKQKQIELGYRRFDNIVKTVILIEKYIKLGSVLVVCKGAGTCESLCAKSFKYLSSKGLLSNIRDDEDIKKAVEIVKFEMGEKSPLINFLQHGIVYHHAKMPDLVKETIENLISNKKIDIVFATTTLAQGMNFPISTIIFSSLKVGAGRDSKDIDNTTFWNFAGRAGRAYMDKEGHVIIINTNDNAETERKTIDYIKNDTEKIFSSLGRFFDEIDEDFKIDYEYLKNNPAMSNFLQYLNHILNVSYNYDIKNINTMKIRSMLNNCLLYRQLEFQEGFMEAQQKVADFSFKYIQHLKGTNKVQLKLADVFGVSDISFSRMHQRVKKYKNYIETSYEPDKVEEYLKVSKIILDSKNPERLAPIVNIINTLPEMDLELTGKGVFNALAISKIIIGWVNGRKITDIAKEIKYKSVSYDEVLKDCHHFVNSKLKVFVPWGMSMYQTLTSDLEGENEENLPSYIYYGVNDLESVIISKVGVPRFAVNSIKRILKTQYPEEKIEIRNIERLKKIIPNIKAEEYDHDFFGYNKEIIKKIIDERLY